MTAPIQPVASSPLPPWLQGLLGWAQSRRDVTDINGARRPPELRPAGGAAGAARAPTDVVAPVRPDALPPHPSFEHRVRAQITGVPAQVAASTQTPLPEQIGQYGNLTPLTLDDVMTGVTGMVKNPRTPAERIQNAVALAMLVLPMRGSLPGGAGAEALASIEGTAGRGFELTGARSMPVVSTARAQGLEDMQALTRRLSYARSQFEATPPVLSGRGLPPAAEAPGLRAIPGEARGLEVTGARATPPVPASRAASLDEMQGLTRRLEYARRNPQAMFEQTLREQISGKPAATPSAPERIAAPAVRRNGKVFTGINHGDAYTPAEATIHTQDREGFLTTNGRYVSRHEAGAIADVTKQRQLAPAETPYRTMISEDLHRSNLGSERGVIFPDQVPQTGAQLPGQASTHFYHTTPAQNVADIGEQGLLPRKPSFRGEQSSWPRALGGSGREGRVYLGASEKGVTPFSEPGNVTLRINGDYAKGLGLKEEFAGRDFFTRKAIPPEYIEVMKDGRWERLRPHPFEEAVQNTPGARISEQGLHLRVTRGQLPEQAGEPSVRGGVFYLPEGSPQMRHYRSNKVGYGGAQKISGETVVQRPLFVKGATGGKAPEQGFIQLKGKPALQALADDIHGLLQKSWHSSMMPTVFPGKGKITVEDVANILEKHGGDPDLAGDIVQHSTKGNTLRYAIQENVFANVARQAGHDAILGYSTSRKTGKPFLSELFDLRESHYPVPGEPGTLHPDIAARYRQQGYNTTKMLAGTGAAAGAALTGGLALENHIRKQIGPAPKR